MCTGLCAFMCVCLREYIAYCEMCLCRLMYACVCREQGNLSDLCVDPLPSDWHVCDADDLGSHWSSCLGRRSDHIDIHSFVKHLTTIINFDCF